MNVVSFMNGDAHVSDYPEGCFRPLSILVQTANDLLAGTAGYLSPADAITVLDLAFSTTNTAALSSRAVHAWLVQLLTDTYWGVAQFAHLSELHLMLAVADLHRRAAHGDRPQSTEWAQTQAAARKHMRNCSVAGSWAMRAAIYSATTSYSDTAAEYSHLDRVMLAAVNAHCATHKNRSYGNCVVGLARNAIHSWQLIKAHEQGAFSTKIATRSDAKAATRTPLEVMA